MRGGLLVVSLLASASAWADASVQLSARAPSEAPPRSDWRTPWPVVTVCPNGGKADVDGFDGSLVEWRGPAGAIRFASEQPVALGKRLVGGLDSLRLLGHPPRDFESKIALTVSCAGERVRWDCFPDGECSVVDVYREHSKREPLLTQFELGSLGDVAYARALVADMARLIKLACDEHTCRDDPRAALEAADAVLTDAHWTVKLSKIKHAVYGAAGYEIEIELEPSGETVLTIDRDDIVAAKYRVYRRDYPPRCVIASVGPNVWSYSPDPESWGIGLDCMRWHLPIRAGSRELRLYNVVKTR